jgi:hypothetical protein
LGADDLDQIGPGERRLVDPLGCGGEPRPVERGARGRAARCARLVEGCAVQAHPTRVGAPLLQ